MNLRTFFLKKIDNKTVLVDSENNLHANLDIDSVPVMTGATSSVDGEKGLVPQPQIGDNLKCLRGDATWQYIIDFIWIPIFARRIVWPVRESPILQFYIQIMLLDKQLHPIS